MRKRPVVRVYGHGLPEELTPGGPPGQAPATAVIDHDGCKIFVRFDRGDLTGEGPVRAVLIQPEERDGELDPNAVRKVMANPELYFAYARKAMRTLSSEHGTFEERQRAFSGAARALRQAGGPGRGYDDSFYETIGEQYRALVDEGNPHPVKAIGERNHITISGASRWIKEARRRGYIDSA